MHVTNYIQLRWNLIKKFQCPSVNNVPSLSTKGGKI